MNLRLSIDRKMSRYAARKDTNHVQIEAVFRRLLADHVTDSSRWGSGAGDLFVSFGGYSVFIEIKLNRKSKLTRAQKLFQYTHPGSVERCESVDEAIKLCAIIRSRAMCLC